MVPEFGYLAFCTEVIQEWSPWGVCGPLFVYEADSPDCLVYLVIVPVCQYYVAMNLR